MSPVVDATAKTYYIEGIFIQAEIVNGNGRKYPLDVLQREVARYNESHIKKNRAIGELDHPDTPIVNYKAASHKIVSMEQDGNNFIGKALILNTPNGNIVKGLIEGGVTLAVSTRGVGTVETENGISVVQRDFILSTVDIVADPSAPDAFVNGVMEGQEWIMESGIWVTAKAEDIRRKAHKKEISEEQLIKEFKKLCRNLLGK